jgi:hypothetical protein
MPDESAKVTDADVPPAEADERVSADIGTDAGNETTGTGDGEMANDDDGTDVRSVVVPTRVYKAVTVFSTLFAVVTVVGGFIVLDVATKRASVALSEVDPLAALAGVALIATGAVTYAFSTRFQAAGMGNGNAKDDTDERSHDG